MNKRLRIIVPFLLAAVAAASGSCAPSKEAERVSLTRLRVGYIPVADCSQLFVAIERGYFADRQIEIEPVSLAGGAKILEALGSGSLDVGFSNLVSLILAHDAGLPFLALTGGPVEDAAHKEHAIMVGPKSSISSLRELAGTTIALNTRRNIDELMVSRLLTAAGVRLDTVKFVEVPFPRMLSTLEKGDVTAISAIEPYVTIGLATNSAKVLSYNYVEVQPSTQISTFVATRAWLTQNESVAKRFREAIGEATAHAEKDPVDVRSILAKYTSIEKPYLSRVVLPRFSSQISEDGLGDLIRQVREAGWIDKEFYPRDILGDFSDGH